MPWLVCGQLAANCVSDALAGPDNKSVDLYDTAVWCGLRQARTGAILGGFAPPPWIASLGGLSPKTRIKLCSMNN